MVNYNSWNPDHDWSPGIYTGPTGLGAEFEPCRHSDGGSRSRVGPTGRKKQWMILVAHCAYCGRHTRSHEDLTWDQYIWLRRWNLGTEKSYGRPNLQRS